MTAFKQVLMVVSVCILYILLFGYEEAKWLIFIYIGLLISAGVIIYLIRNVLPLSFKKPLMITVSSGFLIGLIMMTINFVIGAIIMLVTLFTIRIFSVGFKLHKSHVIVPETTLEEKVKNDLDLNWTITKTSKFPRIFNFIGGFMSPLLPMFTMKNENWEKKLNDEAVIHELQHIRLLFDGWILLIIIGGIVASIISNFVYFKTLANLVFAVSFSIVLTLFEYHTFYATKKYADKIGIITRGFSSKLAVKYMTYYSIYLFLSLTAIKFVLSFISSFS